MKLYVPDSISLLWISRQSKVEFRTFGRLRLIGGVSIAGRPSDQNLKDEKKTSQGNSSETVLSSYLPLPTFVKEQHSSID